MRRLVKVMVALAGIVVLGSSMAMVMAGDVTIGPPTPGITGATRPSRLEVSVTPDRVNGTYVAGEAARLTIKVNRDAFVAVFDVDAIGRVARLFPNANQRDGFVRAGLPVEIGGGARLTVNAPYGSEVIDFVAAKTALEELDDARFQGTGPFQTLVGGTTTLALILDKVAHAPPRDGEPAYVVGGMTLRTMAARPAGSSTGVGTPTP